jgi:hypothetical protein
MIVQLQWAQVGAKAWIAHSKLSNVCERPAMTTSNALSYSFPQTSHCAMPLSPCCSDGPVAEAQQQSYRAGIDRRFNSPRFLLKIGVAFADPALT